MLRKWLRLFAVLCLAGCLAVPVLYFIGLFDAVTYKRVLLALSIGWFVFATAWATRR
jgi:cephalosporin-C deacetylase-like acetyl esterase